MRTRSSLPFRAAPLRVEDPPSHGTLLTAFLSSLSLDERSACAVLFGAAARHFLHWLELHGIAVRTIDDRAVRRFEKHRCRCHRYSAQQPVYKADIAARVRRFVRFLEDQGYVEVDDGIDDLPRHLADYFDAINSLQLAQGPAQSYRSEAEHVVAWLRIARRRWADIDDTIIDQYAV
ncbi:MAG: integrase, partial [Sphingobium sp.]|nr:integrase [Sphingobium sp.]MCI2053891.1 integrase [Sphingobium sp.]